MVNRSPPHPSISDSLRSDRQTDRWVADGPIDWADAQTRTSACIFRPATLPKNISVTLTSRDTHTHTNRRRRRRPRNIPSASYPRKMPYCAPLTAQTRQDFFPSSTHPPHGPSIDGYLDVPSSHLISSGWPVCCQDRTGHKRSNQTDRNVLSTYRHRYQDI